MLNLIAGLVIAFLGWLLGRAIGYVIGFRGGRSLLERSGRTQKFRLKTIDKGEKLFERFTWQRNSREYEEMSRIIHHLTRGLLQR
jgi:membrane protein DedA with SNARE-associated domain